MNFVTISLKGGQLKRRCKSFAFLFSTEEVCVSHPVPKGLLHSPMFPCRGARPPAMNLVQRSKIAGGEALRDVSVCTCDQRLHKLSNPLGLIHGGYMFPPTNPFPAAELVTASIVQIDFEATCEQCSTIPFWLTHSPCCSFTFLLDLGTE